MTQRVWRGTAAAVMWMALIPAAWAQAPGGAPLAGTDVPAAVSGMDAQGLPVPMMTACCPEPGCACGGAGCDGGCSLYVGVEFLMARPHFSEAIAFAELNAGAVPPRVDGRELHFGYDPSYRIRVGSRPGGTGGFGNGTGGIRGTYWHFDGDTAADGTPGATTVLVDPFGNVAAAGMRLETDADVRMNVYDLEFVSPHDWDGGRTSVAWTVGVRVADVDQSYESFTAVGPAVVAFGDFSADFIGAGPRIGLEAAHRCRPCSPLALFASAHGSLLLGEHDIQSSNTNPLVPPLNGAQRESLTRTIPVVEMELGAAWHGSDRWSVAAGWMIQAWFDLGTSGGLFDPLLAPVPVFNGADDGNLMSFDGFFVRAKYGW